MDHLYGKIMKDDIELLNQPQKSQKSQIQEFYTGKTIFLTGCTGYVGTCVVEKLLRSSPRLKRIYILIRSKPKASVNDRMEKYFKNIIFDSLRETDPDFKKKVVPLEGDLMQTNLGLSSKDRNIVIEETDIIIHNAATVMFDAPISMAFKINVIGTKDMLDLATQCKRIKAFVYVSTAYSHCYQKKIEEKFYDPPADLKMVEDMLKADQENESGLSPEALEGALGDWPNVYTFTKATAESIVHDYGRKVSFPCCVFRPSIVTSTWKEPIRSWCGNANGPQTVFMAIGLGVVHTMWAYDSPIDFVPADMATNALLAVTWDLVENKKNEKQARMYNYGTSVANPITLRNTQKLMVKDGLTLPSIKAKWCYFFVFTKCYYAFYLMHLMFHFIPAALGDLILLVQGKTPMALAIFFKVTKHLDKLVYFTHGDWRLHVTEMSKIWDRMNEADNELFYCDLRKLSWEDYFQDYWMGIRVFVLNDPMSTLEVARHRYRKLEILHYSLVTLLAGLFLYYSLQFLQYIFIN